MNLLIQIVVDILLANPAACAESISLEIRLEIIKIL